MGNLFMRYPYGRKKVLTLSYDDGIEQDKRLIKILDKYGIKCTFNVNSGIYTAEEQRANTKRMTENEITELFKNSSHEIALHSFTHPFLEQLPTNIAVSEIIKDREKLEKQFGNIIRGMAYPYGSTSDEVVDILKLCGIAYSRTTISTNSFSLPENWLRLNPTCHHNSNNLMQLAKRFVEEDVKYGTYLFFVWGHSYEFDNDNNWDTIEKFAEYVGKKDDVWYATNMNIYEYIHAYKQLIFSVDGTMVKNPTVYTLYFSYSDKEYFIEPNKELWL